jgi:hypothetical protein
MELKDPIGTLTNEALMSGGLLIVTGQPAAKSEAKADAKGPSRKRSTQPRKGSEPDQRPVVVAAPAAKAARRNNRCQHSFLQATFATVRYRQRYRGRSIHAAYRCGERSFAEMGAGDTYATTDADTWRSCKMPRLILRCISRSSGFNSPISAKGVFITETSTEGGGRRDPISATEETQSSPSSFSIGTGTWSRII